MHRYYLKNVTKSLRSAIISCHWSWWVLQRIDSNRRTNQRMTNSHSIHTSSVLCGRLFSNMSMYVIIETRAPFLSSVWKLMNCPEFGFLFRAPAIYVLTGLQTITFTYNTQHTRLNAYLVSFSNIFSTLSFVFCSIPIKLGSKWTAKMYMLHKN